ncbi:hypothetical protein SLEP1_g51671 [Rubroshorea leprosula]|uniref:Uncharacterized protein n=1 Tax=Rubroshorea leprosula TaxID=152421 RepID=A0AAV5M6H1_9ROSI|nr:hypothetical protein SLEP1_g51671 [Rubroshorea leprosula]
MDSLRRLQLNPKKSPRSFNQFVQNFASSSSCTHLRNRYVQLLSSPVLDSLLEATNSGSGAAVPSEDWCRLADRLVGLR